MSAIKVGHHIASLNLFLMPDGHVEMLISPSAGTSCEAKRLGAPVLNLVSAAMRSAADRMVLTSNEAELEGGTVQ